MLISSDSGGKIMENYSPYSELKIFRHVDRIEGLIKGKRVAPIYVRIKPTNVCNQNCFYCGYANDQLYDGRQVDHRESIKWECLKQALADLSQMGIKAVTFSGGGEPLCYHSIDKALDFVQKANIDYSMITNGQALEGEILDYLKNAKWIRVSFDSFKSETYEDIRGVHTYMRVIHNIENFAKLKSKTCTLGINCVITKRNADQIYDICRLVRELGVNNIKLSPIMIKENEADYHNIIKEVVTEQIAHAKQELENEFFKIVDKYTNDLSMNNNYRKNYHRCIIQELFAVIAADSKVYRCHQRAYTKAGMIGDLKEQTFKEMWYAQHTIDNSRKFDAYEECRFRCAFDERNILLNDFLYMDVNHVNFI